MNRLKYNAAIGILLVGCAHAQPGGKTKSPPPESAKITDPRTGVDSGLDVNHNEETLFPDSIQRTQHRFAILRDLIYRHSRVTGMLPDHLEPIVQPFKKEGATLLDAWNRPVVYTRRDKEYELRSAGMDGVLNTDDDLVQSGYSGVAPL